MEKIKALEKQLKTAMLNSDVVQLDNLISDDLIFTNHLGQIMTKADDLAAHESGQVKIDKIVFSEQKINKTKKRAIVSVIAAITGSFGGEKSTLSLRFTRIWEEDDEDNWKLVCGHSTLIQ